MIGETIGDCHFHHRDHGFIFSRQLPVKRGKGRPFQFLIGGHDDHAVNFGNKDLLDMRFLYELDQEFIDLL